MPTRTPKEYRYEQANAILVVGYDEGGRLFSYIKKNGKMMAQNMYIKMPTAEALEKQGWKITHE